MKNQKKQLFILVFCLVILLGGYVCLMKYNEKQAEVLQEAVAEPIVQVFSEEIKEFSYDYEGETYRFVLEEDVWKNKEDTSLNIDQTIVGNMVSQISQITADTTLENVEDLSLYGLDTPERIIAFATADVSVQIQIGDYNSMQDLYYLRVDEGTTVYAITSIRLKTFKYTLDDLIIEETSEDATAEDIE